MTEVEKLAFAIIKGDLSALPALIDSAIDLYESTGRTYVKQLEPVKVNTIKVSPGKVRIIGYCRNGHNYTPEIPRLLEEWWTRDIRVNTCAYAGLERIEVYQIEDIPGTKAHSH